MTFVRHLRVTLAGTLGDGREIFSYGLSLARQNASWLGDLLAPDFPDSVYTDDWRDKCIDFHQSAAKIRTNAHLKRITIAQIGPDGRYEHAPAEYAVNNSGGYISGSVMPWQTSLAVTLHTKGDLERVKGRFYLPSPATSVDPDTDLIPTADAESYRDAAVGWINAMGDQPGLDILDWRVVVASQGRHNPNGTVRAAPANYDVEAVSVGRRLDVIRRRANRATEARVAKVDTSQV